MIFLTNNFLFFGIYAGVILMVFSSFSRAHTSTSRILFTLLVFTMTARLTEFALYRTNNLVPHLFFTSIPFTLLAAPTFYLYIQHVFFGSKINIKTAVHLIPFLISLGLLFPFYVLDEGSKITYVNILKAGGGLSVNHIIYLILGSAQFALYSILIFNSLKSYLRTFVLVRSDEKFEIAKWVISFLYGIVIYLSIYFVAYLVLLSNHSIFAVFELSLYLSLCVFIQFLLLFSIRTNFRVFDQLAIDKPKYTTSNIKGMDFDPFIEKLRQTMQEKELYLDPNLRISHLAEILNIPPSHMSQMINEGAKTTFYDFVNEYRIDKARELLKSERYKSHTLLGIAMDAGFSNKSTFNRTFKRHTKMTPTQYIKHLEDRKTD